MSPALNLPQANLSSRIGEILDIGCGLHLQLGEDNGEEKPTPWPGEFIRSPFHVLGLDYAGQPAGAPLSVARTADALLMEISEGLPRVGSFLLRGRVPREYVIRGDIGQALGVIVDVRLAQPDRNTVTRQMQADVADFLARCEAIQQNCARIWPRPESERYVPKIINRGLHYY